MGDICVLGKLCAVFFALVLIITPVNTAWAAGNSQNNMTNSTGSTKSVDEKNGGSAAYNDRKSLTGQLGLLQPVSTFPLDLNQQAHEIISSISPVKDTNNNDITKKLETAELHIAGSIDSGAWYDREHLKPDVVSDIDCADGDTEPCVNTIVFRDGRTAVQNILEVISKNKDNTVDDELLMDVLINLVQADRNIADTAIEDARVASSLPAGFSAAEREEIDRYLEKAQRSFDRADEQVSKGEPIDAIRHFEKAWVYATTALVKTDAVITPVVVFDPTDMYTNRTGIILSGHVEDVATYTMQDVVLTVNGDTSTLELVDGGFSSSLDLNEGDNIISVSATDAFGNTGTSSLTIIVDTVPPVISYSGAEDGRYYNRTVAVSANMSDEHPDTLTILVNGNPYIGDTPIVGEGTYYTEITACDLAGNTARRSLTFHIDMTPPQVRISEPANGSFVSSGVVVNSSVTDASPVITSMLVDGYVPVMTGELLDSTAYVDGTHNITVSAQDAAGNSASESITVIIDNTPPEVSILEPMDNEAIRGIRQVLADVYDLYLRAVVLSINDEAVSDSPNHTFETTDYPDGNYTISARAVDFANNTGYDTISVIVDNTPPAINITSPANNSFVKGTVIIDADVVEPNPAVVNALVDGLLLSESLPAVWDSVTYPDGSHSAGVYVADTAGNDAFASVSVIVDNTAPEVEITAPANGSAVRSVVNITADAYDAYLANTTLSINGTAVSGMSEYTWNTTTYADGWYNITVTATDMAANTGTNEIWVEVDNTPPELVVNELTDNPTLDEPQYRINGTVESDAILIVNGITVPHDGSFEYAVNLVEGTNVITVTATDAAGNSARWIKTRMVDSDRLPDWYEINVTGTDPLDGDSDSTKTDANENDNGIMDDKEDFDADRVVNVLEYSFKSSPFSSDSDNDSLLDAFELVVAWTNLSSPDSDGNGISDAYEDFDNDTLVNLDEQSYGTNPHSSDTDNDRLTDHQEISVFYTNASKKDTDDDGLEDYDETLLNTNPRNPDTDGDGTIDSEESYATTVEHETVRVEVTAQGTSGNNLTIQNSTVNVLLKQMPGNIGDPVDIRMTSEFSHARIEMSYDPAKLNGSDEANLKIYYYDESSHMIIPVPVQGVNTRENYVWAETEHFSTYGLYDYYKWLQKMRYVNDPTDAPLSVGKQTIINANVRNEEPVPADNVRVNFYNGNPASGGALIGHNTISSISGNGKATASIRWTVTADVESVYVSVDPSNGIQESDEGNNVAYKLIDDTMIDSDGDGLSDYDEVHGIRTNVKVYRTDPDNPDSDGDGVDDGTEIGDNKEWNWLIPGYYFDINSDPWLVDSDDDDLDDDDEYDYGTYPLNPHSDSDNVKDGDEIEIGTSPLDWDSDDDGIADGVHYIIATELVFEELRRTLSEQGINDETINIIISKIEKETPSWPPKEFTVYHNPVLGYMPKGFPVLWTVDGEKMVSDSQLEFGLKDSFKGYGGVNSGSHEYLSNILFDGLVPISGGTIEMQPYADIGSFRLKGENKETLIIVKRGNPEELPVEHEYIVEYIIGGVVIIVVAGVIIICAPAAGAAVGAGAAALIPIAALAAMLASVTDPEEFFKLLEDEGFEVYSNTAC